MLKILLTARSNRNMKNHTGQALCKFRCRLCLLTVTLGTVGWTATGKRSNTNITFSLLSNSHQKKPHARKKDCLFVAVLWGSKEQRKNSGSGFRITGRKAGELTASWTVQEILLTHKSNDYFESCQEEHLHHCPSHHRYSHRSCRYFWWYFGTISLLRAGEKKAGC